jgi:filamentous hemagglutinin family protein
MGTLRVGGRLVARLLAGLLAAVPVASGADVVRDGTVGPGAGVQPAGPAFLIDETLGETRGSNLFHSFLSFDLDSGQSATFSGPAGLANIIGRVTGGGPSAINGAILSAVPGADLYLFNPAGWAFGPGSFVSVDGSFHVSSADFLRLGADEVFSADASQPLPLLGTAAPSAFGFLGTAAGISADATSMRVGQNERLSFVGGPLLLDTSGEGSLSAPSGRIDLLSVLSPGEALLGGTGADGLFGTADDQGPDVGAFASLGPITLNDATLTVSEEEAGGTIAIRGDSFSVMGSSLVSRTFGSGSGTGITAGAPLGIDVNVRGTLDLQTGLLETLGYLEARGGGIRLEAARIVVGDDFSVRTEAQIQGFAGDIDLIGRDSIEVGSLVESVASEDSTGGDVRLRAPSIDVLSAGTVRTEATSGGFAGDVELRAGGTVRVAGLVESEAEAGVGPGVSGNLSFFGDRVLFDGGRARISHQGGDGALGDILVRAGDIDLENGSILSNISSSTTAPAGGIELSTTGSTVTSINSAMIVSGTQAGAGDIRVLAGGLVQVRNSTWLAQSGGSGGNILVVANRFDVQGRNIPTGDFRGGFQVPPSTIQGEVVSVRITEGYDPEQLERKKPRRDVDEDQDQAGDEEILVEQRAPVVRDGRCALFLGGRGSHFAATGRAGLPPLPGGTLPVAAGLAWRSAPAADTPGMEAWKRGALELAATRFREASESAEAGSAERLSALLALAEAHHALGEYDRAEAVFGEASALAEKRGDAAGRAAALGGLGNTRLALGPVTRGRDLLQEAESAALAAGDRRLAAALGVNLGNALLFAGEAPAAEAKQSEAAGRARAAGDANLETHALTGAARAALAALDTRRAGARLQEAEGRARSLEDSHDAAYLWISIGRSFEELAAQMPSGRAAPLRSAYASHRSGEAMATRLGDDLAATWARGHLAWMYDREHRRVEALELADRAGFAAQRVDAPEAQYQWTWLSGRIQAEEGQPAEAAASYRRAIDLVQSIRHQRTVGYGMGRGRFDEEVRPLFYGLVDALLRQAAAETDAERRQDLLAEARDALELMNLALLRDFYGDECLDIAEPRGGSRAELLRTAVVVHPVLLPDRTELLVSWRDRMERFSVPVPGPRLEQELRRFRGLLEKRTSAEFMPQGQRLYDWLVRPYEATIADSGLGTLIFVPDGALRNVPMAALHDGRQFLIEKYAVGETPGLDLTEAAPLDPAQPRMMLAALSEGVQGFPALGYVPEEVEAVRRLYPGALLVDDDFRLARIEETLGAERYGLVHIASHGVFGKSPQDTFLLTYDDRLTMDRMDAYVGMFRFRDRPLDLLTLSACETAAADERSGLGLAGIAVKAGANSVLGSLWKVNDRAAASLMTEFYRQIREEGAGRAVALQRAQQQLLAEPDARHPYYWSPFVLIRSWQ